MLNGTILVLGNISDRTLDGVAAEFGWSVEWANSYERFVEAAKEREIIAVLFERQVFDLTCEAALRMLRDTLPAALPIVCVRLSDVIDWPNLASAGAFHTVLLPMAKDEVRQTLGFVWAANCRTTSIHSVPRSKTQAAGAGRRVA